MTNRHFWTIFLEEWLDKFSVPENLEVIFEAPGPELYFLRKSKGHSFPDRVAEQGGFRKNGGSPIAKGGLVQARCDRKLLQACRQCPNQFGSRLLS